MFCTETFALFSLFEVRHQTTPKILLTVIVPRIPEDFRAGAKTVKKNSIVVEGTRSLPMSMRSESFPG